MIKNKIQIYTM